jgi:hypothetical protein
VQNTPKVTGLGPFDEAITAEAIKAVANTSTINSSAEGLTKVDPKIADEPIGANVAVNTEVDLPGAGHVILKSVRKSGDGERLGKITVEMLTSVVTETNTLGFPIGSRILVAHTVCGYSRTDVKAELGGHAYAAEALPTTDLIKN